MATINSKEQHKGGAALSESIDMIKNKRNNFKEFEHVGAELIRDFGFK